MYIVQFRPVVVVTVAVVVALDTVVVVSSAVETLITGSTAVGET